MNRRTRIASGVAAALIAASAGCYQHVVGARGYGASEVPVHEANAPDLRPADGRSKTPLERKPPSRLRGN